MIAARRIFANKDELAAALAADVAARLADAIAARGDAVLAVSGGSTPKLLFATLSKTPDLKVSAPTASFYFKGRQTPIADIGRSLGVTYVLDGSVRKSDATLRIAARLLRTDDGFVVWSETYDRPPGDRLMVQDDIAAEVAKALKGSID